MSPAVAEDILIAIARPDGMTAANDEWYDPLMTRLGYCTNGRYKVGHAAVVLLERATGRLSYFDFGRYHTPPKRGRVRSSRTDPDLTIPLRAQFSSDGERENKEEILTRINNHRPFHGEGDMFAALYDHCSYMAGCSHAFALQQQGMIAYGPFTLSGSNCSRFVNSVCRKASTTWYAKLRWLFAPTLTPTTLHNVIIHHTYYHVHGREVTERRRKTTLFAKRFHHVP